MNFRKHVRPPQYVAKFAFLWKYSRYPHSTVLNRKKFHFASDKGSLYDNKDAVLGVRDNKLCCGWLFVCFIVSITREMLKWWCVGWIELLIYIIIFIFIYARLLSSLHWYQKARSRGSANWVITKLEYITFFKILLYMISFYFKNLSRIVLRIYMLRNHSTATRL